MKDWTNRRSLVSFPCAPLVLLLLCGRLLLADGGDAGPPAGAPPDRHPFTVHDLLAMERLSDPQVSPDGRQVAFTARVTDLEANRGRTDICLVGAEGGAPRRLTTHAENDGNPRWTPDGRIVFLSDRSGSTQVWSIDPAGGEAVQLTSFPLEVGNLEVVPQLESLLFTLEVYPGTTVEETVRRDEELKKRQASGRVYEELLFRHWDGWEDGKRSHLFLRPIAGKDEEARDLFPGLDADVPTHPFGGSEEFAVSPDGAEVVFTAKLRPGSEAAWTTDFDLYTVAGRGEPGAPRCLTEANEAWDTAPVFSPDGRTLAWLAMVRPGFESDRLRIVLLDRDSGARRVLTEAWDRSPGDLLWSADGRTLYCTAEHLGQRPLFAVDAVSGGARIVVGEGRCAAPRLFGERLLFTRQSLTSPDELWTVLPDGRDLRRLTDFNGQRLAACLMGEPEQFTFRGWNGEEVYAYVVKPAGFDPAKKYPVVFLIHGGPQGSFGNEFHYRWNPQTYTGAGFATVAVDFHGSTGYGQAFTDAISGHWGDRPYEDLVKGLDAALARYPWMDGERVVAAGASFGGYMINWIAGRPFASRFRAFVCHDGNLDERMAYYDTEELWFPEWENGGPPWAAPGGAYREFNPIEHVGEWRVPTLVVHGGRDYRVVDTQGLSTFTALRRRGIPARLLHFPDENHWVLKPQNSLQWHEEVLAWLEKWTGEGTSAASPPAP